MRNRASEINFASTEGLMALINERIGEEDVSVVVRAEPGGFKLNAKLYCTRSYLWAAGGFVCKSRLMYQEAHYRRCLP